ncbi:MAG: response regulator [Burkholderiaceae bacterium]
MTLYDSNDPAAARPAPRHLLVVDDDMRLTSLAADFLGRHGFTIEIASSGELAWAAIERTTFDLITLDLMLPGIDGLELCRRLRARHDARRSTPVLMLTARAETIDRIVGLEMGADDYLPKPFEPRELLARIHALLRRPPLQAGSSTEIKEFGRLRIDPETREVSIGGEVRHLTAHQFSVLYALAERAGRVVSREQLADLLNQPEGGATGRAIDIHVARIRAAIEDDPRAPKRIQTVRGVGYLFARQQD